MERITSVSNSKVKETVLYSTKAEERRRADVYVAEGRKMFWEAPTEQLCRIYVSDGLLEEDAPLRRRLEAMEQEEQIPVVCVTDEVFRKMSDTRTPQGILCVLRRKHYTLEEMLAGGRPLLLVLEDLQDPGNLGTIMRTGEGAGVNGVIMSRDTVDLYNPKTIRATMGSIYRVPFLYVDDLGATIEALRRRSIRCCAAALQGRCLYGEYDYCGGTAFFIGNEGNGLRPETVERADAVLRIPMQGKVESLNASVAAALLMYEAVRQRGKAADTVWGGGV